MPFQFENRYVMTEEMLREYTGRVVCRGLAKNCALFSGLCALLCLAAIRLRHLGAAAVLGSFAALGLAVGAFLFSVLLGIGFGLYPAAKASGLTPVEALRSE